VAPLNWRAPVAVREVVPVTPEEAPPMLLSAMALPVIVSDARGVEAPMGCVRDTFPLPAVIVNAWAPLTVPERTTPAVPALEFSVAAPTRLIGSEKAICPLIVVAVPAKLSDPVPSMIYEPSIDVVLPTVPVKTPEFVTWTEPPFVVTREPARKKFVPTNSIPAGAFVLSEPVTLKVPLLANTLMEEATTERVVKLFVLTTEKMPNRVPTPKSLLKRISPVPAVSVSDCAPSRVFDKVIEPLPGPVLSAVAPVRVMGLAKERFWFAVETVPASETDPVPVWVKVPVDERVLPAVVVKTAELEMVIFPAAVALPKRVKPVPVRLSAPPVVVTSPLKVVSTEPAD